MPYKLLAGIFIATLVAISVAFVYTKAFPAPPEIAIASPERITIRQAIIANGNILPREEIRIRPQISGVIRQIHVRTGDRVAVGDLLAEVDPQPSPADVNEADIKLRESVIRLNHARRELQRSEKIRSTGAITDTEFRQLQLNAEIAQANLEAAERLVEIVRTGASVDLGHSHSEVRSTIAGTVLERPVDIGSFVIEMNPFNQGTTIVKLADMGDLIFTGEVDEESAGQLQIGMPLLVTVGAFPGLPINAVIEAIAPQSSQRREAKEIPSMAGVGNGAITTFEIHAKLIDVNPAIELRAGYSATADIELGRATDVMAVLERDLRFRDGEAYVLLEAADGTHVEQAVKLGLSDGLHVEILHGISEQAQIVTAVNPSPTHH